MDEVHAHLHIPLLDTVKYVSTADGADRHRMHGPAVAVAAAAANTAAAPPGSGSSSSETRSAPLSDRYSIIM